MKKTFACVILAIVAVVSSGCKKKETAGTKLDTLIDQAEEKATSAEEKADQTAADLQQKLDEVLKK